MLTDISMSYASNAYMIFPDDKFTLAVKSFQIPSLSVGQTQIPRPIHSQWQAHSIHGNIEQLTIMFYMDELYRNYFYILNWLSKLRYAVELNDATKDATLIILNNHKIPIIQFDFKYMYPVSLGELDLDIASAEVIQPFATFACDIISYKYLPESGITESGKF